MYDGFVAPRVGEDGSSECDSLCMTTSPDTPPSSSSLASDKSVRSELMLALDLDRALPGAPRIGEKSCCCSVAKVSAVSAWPRFGSVLSGATGVFGCFRGLRDMMRARRKCNVERAMSRLSDGKREAL